MRPTSKVSVLMITYNHEKYIGQAIESVLAQMTDFEFELVIGDDCSTDNTPKIIHDYYDRYPNIIKPIIRKQNIGANSNYVDCFHHCQGKYIANCEGDDYWTDTNKLQKQVDFLEENEEYGLICSQIECVDSYGIDISNNPYYIPQEMNLLSTDDFFWALYGKNFIYTVTVCYRKELLNSIIKRIEKENLIFPYDHWFWLQIALNHKIHIMNEVLAIYRIHDNGISKSKSFFIERKGLVALDIIDLYLKKYYTGIDKKHHRKIGGHLYWLILLSDYGLKIKLKAIRLGISNFYKILC